ncbi:MAG: hypothetical protein LBN02_06580 [Oscillospiraceae bacterium]|jgi:DNA-directed RNA polymerase specialized sigma24 family protein|nr:hypothetical protein [Oscillospiraceae bacterium]
MRERYIIRVGDELVEVTPEVYREYYASRRREKTQAERDARHGLLRIEDLLGAEFVADTGQTPDETAIARDELSRLRDALNRLNDDERELIHALFFRAVPLARYADETGVPRKTLEYRRDTVLARLRRELTVDN